MKLDKNSSSFIHFFQDSKNNTIKVILFALLVFFISLFTYFYNYTNPPGLFWDENYHIASAEKYIEGVFFMEPHPPLGKEIIALGEILIHPNDGIDKSAFTKTDYIKDIPKGFSFAGYRFFPALAATFCAVLIFFIFYEISCRPFLSFLGTSLYLFENAIIVHSRGAMLESIQLFFILATILYFLIQWKKKRIKVIHYFILGLLASAAIAVKVNSLIIAPLGIALLFKEYWESLMGFAKAINRKKYNLNFVFESIFKICIFVIGLLIVFVASYYLHFVIAKKIVDGNYYTASDDYKKILDNGEGGLLINLPLELREHLYFSDHYTKGVPALNVCKADENGSYPLEWPLGGKTINYRWESNGDTAQYLYLVGNPVIWMIGLASVILTIILVLGHYCFGLKIKNQNLFNLIQIFLALYIGYMISVLMVERVLYLYHYIIPLVISMILAFLLFLYQIEHFLESNRNKYNIYILVLVVVTLIFEVFLYFSPLTYYQPITREQFQKREWFPIWQLKSV